MHICVLLKLPLKHLSLGPFPGVRPVGESWTEDCVLALQRRVVNRILRIEITGEHDGKLLVTMIDEASDPQANMAELLSSAGFAVPVPTISDQQADQTASAAVDPQGVRCMKSESCKSFNIILNVASSVYF